MNEEQAWRQRIQEDVKEIKNAVIGDEKIGLTGLVPRMAKLEKWARRLDVRIATVSGGVCVTVWLVQHFWR